MRIRLKYFMRVRDLKTKDLAMAIGKSIPATNHYLNGVASPSIDSLWKMIERLGLQDIPVRMLFDPETEEEAKSLNCEREKMVGDDLLTLVR